MQLNKTLIKQGIYVLLSLILLMPMSAIYAQTAQEEFSKAQQAFKNGNYKQALKQFQQARAMGIKGPAIEYNLGVTQYKLKNYAQAERHFLLLVKNKGMRPLAAYNLGLIGEKLGKQKQAIKYYRIAYNEAEDRKLRTLAWRALGQLGVKLGRPFKPGLDGLVGILYGSDSNVINPANTTTNITDTFTELYGGLFYRMTPSWKLNSFFLNQDYAIANNYDFQLFNLSLDKSFDLGPWKNKVGIFTTNTMLGAKPYEDSVGAQLGAKVALSDTHDLNMRYRFEQISVPVTLNYLKGTRQKIRIERVEHKNYGNRLMYEMEINSRANSTTFSYSPTRQTLRYYRSYRLSKNWRAGGYIGYRISTYTPIAGKTTRQDQRLRFKAKIRRYLGKHWQVVAEYSHGNNQSNLTGYSYTRDLFDFGFKAFY